MSSDTVSMLRGANFDWTVACRNVWHDVMPDVPEIHSDLRREFSTQLDAMSDSTAAGESPIGWVIVGQGGTGKTHLLGQFRAECAKRAASFVLVDMTDVRDFWDTVLLGYFTSLQESLKGDRPQFEGLMAALLGQVKLTVSVEKAIHLLRSAKAESLKSMTDKILAPLSKRFGPQINQYGDVVRAVFALNSEDFGVANVGSAWLQGEEIDADSRKVLGIIRLREKSSNIVRALSWMMSLAGPSVVAMDQLDPIVTQLNLERQTAEVTPALGIINKLGAGLCEFRDAAIRTLTVVSCIERTWQAMKDFTPTQYVDRYQPPRFLGPIDSEVSVNSLVAARLSPCFTRASFKPPYPTWPFKTDWLALRKADSPRQILKHCFAHLVTCFKNNEVRETSPGAEDPVPKPVVDCDDELAKLDAKFESFRSAFKAAPVLDEEQEDGVAAELVRVSLRSAMKERTLPDNVDVQIDETFTGAAGGKPLHARLRLIYPKEESREEHACARVLQRAHHASFKARLRSAMTQAGIDKDLKFRRLVILRTHPVPSGAQVTSLVKEFESLGGIFHAPSEGDLATLDAVRQMEKEPSSCLGEWLKSRQPASKTAVVQEILAKMAAVAAPGPAEIVETPALVSPVRVPPPQVSPPPLFPPAKVIPEVGPPVSQPPVAGLPPVSPPAPLPSVSSSIIASSGILLGHRLIGETPQPQPIMLPPGALKKHGVVFAGAGSGKTVLLKRLIEEATLQGVPSIVIDIANDLAQLGDPPATPPKDASPADLAAAQRFFHAVECIVWTPGKDSGNPIGLAPLPDLTALADSIDEFNEALAMAVDSLKPILAAGGAAANKKEAVLRNALSYLGKNGNCNLQGLADILNDFPIEATTRIANERKLATQMADELNAALLNNPLLRSSGPVLDPTVLLKASAAGKTRISVISLVGLPTDEQKTHFVNQLAMMLYIWIKKHPTPIEKPPAGLLFIDEVRDFVPSQKSTPCLGSMQRLAFQARKYGLGIVLATQEPKSLDNKIVGQCSTQWYGKMAAPASIETIEELIKARGGSSVRDVVALKIATFYVSNADHLSPPAKLRTPNCFSAHGGAMDAEAVVAKAVASRRLVGPVALENV